MNKNKKAEMTPIGFIISFLIIVVIGIVVIEYTADTAESIDQVTTTNSSNQTVLTGSTATLSPMGTEITSSEVKANNNTWLNFDGVNDRILSSENIITNQTNWTISLWYNNQGVCNSGSVFGYNFAYWIRTGSGCTVRFLSQNTSAQDIQFTPSETILNNTWVHIIYAWNGTHTRGYFNGTEVGSAAQPNIRDRDENFSIGGGVNGEYQAGSIDEVRMYNQSLSDAQITQIYNSGREANSSLPSSGLVLWYSFDENSGTTVHDKSGNGNDGV